MLSFAGWTQSSLDLSTEVFENVRLVRPGVAEIKVSRLREYSVIRIDSDIRRANTLLAISKLHDALADKDMEIGLLHHELQTKDEAILPIIGENAKLKDDLFKSTKKVNNLRPWANVGKVTAVVIAIVVVKVVIDLVKPIEP